MSPSGAAILAHPSPGGHIIYPYTDGRLVSKAVCLYATTGLRDGEGLVLIMAEAHCEPIKRQLADEGWDTGQLERSGELTCLVAEEVLESVMPGGQPGESVFKTIASRLIRAARTRTGGGSRRRVRIFDEMVCLLWNTNLQAALRLEKFWIDVIQTSAASLLCTYPLHGILQVSLSGKTFGARHQPCVAFYPDSIRKYGACIDIAARLNKPVL